MATVKIDSLKLDGPWAAGYVLEQNHTLKSEFLGHDSNGHSRFDTKRSDLGELVFRLKNRSDRSTILPIAETAAAFIQDFRLRFDAIVPVPPSRQRAFQPVLEIALAIGAALSMPVLSGALLKVKKTTELKDVFDFPNDNDY